MTKASLRTASGQAILEFAFMMPLLCVLALGVAEFGWALLAKLDEVTDSEDGQINQ